MDASSITISGGDLRQCYTAEYLNSLGWNVICYHTPDFPHSTGIIRTDSLAHALAHSELVLAPTPLTRDNDNLFQAETDESPCPLEDLWAMLTSRHKFIVYDLPAEHLNLVKNAGCEILTFGNLPFFQNKNAQLTAEGLLAEVIRCTPFALSSADILLLGYGCCGEQIGRLFLPLCRDIYVIEQDEEKQTNARNNGLSLINREDFVKKLPECRIIINTIPGPVLETEQLSQMNSSCHIFDIASAPFGFPSDATEKYLTPYHRIPGIPGRFSPITAGGMIGRTIERMVTHAL